MQPSDVATILIAVTAVSSMAVMHYYGKWKTRQTIQRIRESWPDL